MTGRETALAVCDIEHTPSCKLGQTTPQVWHDQSVTQFSRPFQDADTFVTFEVSLDLENDSDSEATRTFVVRASRNSYSLVDEQVMGTLRGTLIDVRRNPNECQSENRSHWQQGGVVGYAHRQVESSHLLVLRGIKVVPEERGRLLGLFMAAAAIEQFSAARRIDVIAKPYPDYDGDEPGQDYIDEDVEKLRHYFSLLGLRTLSQNRDWMMMHAEDFDPEDFFKRARAVLAGF
ncbi:hypothetical protein [Arthrobacter crystallopoietes]|uniref:hypothetical protein n=1 Tax=Crystallibacter crystallopoietes TaxID=37928 RepID=UPI0011111C32|nr:hypothetical protein [Arthrobacter crystallopoietes]